MSNNKTQRSMMKKPLSRILHAAAALLACGFRRPPQVEFCNIAEGTHAGSITKKTDGAITTRYLLGKFGSDAAHVVACGVAEIPIGVITDEAAAAEDLVNVNLLGVHGSTQLMVASEIITAGEKVYTAANGKVQDIPTTTTAALYEVGLALTASGADGDLIEVATCVPRLTAVE